MLSESASLDLESPAKINLSLAILGKRQDGFHDLHSVVAQTEFGDSVRIQWDPDGPDQDRVLVGEADLPPTRNTLWQAVKLYRNHSGCRHGQITVYLTKRIPIGAGLGGGSSNGVAVLRALRQWSKGSGPQPDWESVAANIGSDCPLFLSDEPVILEGRGDRVNPLAPVLANRIRGKPVVLFKPQFAISTAQAYARLAAARYYQPAALPAELMQEWLAGDELLPPRCNDFERLLADWMPSLAIVLQRLRTECHLDARLSGSGSACFLFPKDSDSASNLLKKVLKDAWGNSFWMQQTFVK